MIWFLTLIEKLCLWRVTVTRQENIPHSTAKFNAYSSGKIIYANLNRYEWISRTWNVIFISNISFTTINKYTTRKPVGFMQSCVNFNTAFDYLLMLTIFHVQKVLIILEWCLCDFLLLKHINEVHALHVHLLFTDFDIFLCGKYSRISILVLIIYWCWHIFHVQNVLIILDWCLCDFLLLLLLKHINEVDGLYPHLSLTYFLCVKCSTISILLLTIY